MPILPTYQSSAQLQQVQQPNVGELYNFGDSIDAYKKRKEEQATFQQKIAGINAKNQVNAAKIQTKNYNDLLLEEFEQDPTSKEEGWFEEQQEKKQQELADQIEDPISRGKFLLESSRDVITTGIKARASYNEAVLEKENSLRVDQYVQTRDMLGDRVGEIYKIAGEAFNDGNITKDQANEEVFENIVGLTVYDAEKSPKDAQAVLQSLLADDGTYPIEGDYMKEAISSVESIYNRDKKRADLNSSIANNIAQSNMQKVLNDKNLSYEEQWRAIDSNEELTDTQKKTFNKALKSNKNIDPTTDAALLMKYGRDLTDLRNRFGYTAASNLQPEDSGKFLKRTQMLRDEIINSYSKGELSHENYLDLSADIDNYSGKKSQQALGKLESTGEYFSLYDNDEAIDFFDTNLPDRTQTPKVFTNYYTSLKRLEHNEEARKQWSNEHPEIEWKGTDDNRAMLANDVLNQHKIKNVQSAVQLMSKYSGLGVSKPQVTEQDFIKQEGRTEADIQKTMKVHNVSRETVLKRMGYGG